MKHAFNIILFLLTIFIPTACNEDKQQPTEGFNIVGAWELARIEYPDGRIDTMDVGKYTRCKIYDADSTYYSIELITDGDVVVIAPHEMAKYTLNDTAYIENGRPTPFRIINDTTMTTVWDGYTEVMHKATTMSESRKDEIRGIVRTFFCENRGTTRLSDFVLSTSERELKSDKQRLVYIIVILVLVAIIMTMVIFRTFKQKLLLERNMRELQEIRNLRPEPIANAIKEAETDLFKSEFYQNLHKKNRDRSQHYSQGMGQSGAEAQSGLSGFLRSAVSDTPPLENRVSGVHAYKNPRHSNRDGRSSEEGAEHNQQPSRASLP